MSLGICDFSPSALTDVATDIDDKYLIGHVDLPQMHIIQHSFGAFRPHFIVSAVPE